MLVEVVVERLATKDDIELLRQDLRALEARIDARLAGIVKDMDGRFKDIDGRFKDMELRITLRMGAMLAATVAIVTALVKLL